MSEEGCWWPLPWWWSRQLGEDGGSGAGCRPDGGSSAGFPRLVRCGPAELGSVLQHGDGPRSMHPNVNGSSMWGASLSTRKASDGDGAGSDPARCGEDGGCRDFQGLLCFSFLFGGLSANVPRRVSLPISSGGFRVMCTSVVLS
jgi:hypothetical protein